MDIKEVQQKLGQCFMIGFEGLEPSEEVRQFISNNNIGSIVLFNRNLDGPAQIADLSNELQEIAISGGSASPLFIGIDMEGGRMAELKAPFTQWPAMKFLGEIGSASLGFKFAEMLGKELLAVGINLNFSPVVDIATNPDNKVIGDRAFSSDPEMVARLSSSVVRGFVKSGLLPCVKHYPGHGDTVADSHEELPVITHDEGRLNDVEFVPFKKAFRARADLLMTAHIRCEKLDPKWPATLSPYLLKDVLREKLGFRNLVLADNMEMKAISQNFGTEEAAVQAFKAGCNIVMYSSSLDEQKKAFEAVTKAFVDGDIPMEVLDSSLALVTKVKSKFLKGYKPVDVTGISKIVGHPEHVKLAKYISRKELPPGLTT